MSYQQLVTIAPCYTVCHYQEELGSVPPVAAMQVV